MSYLTKCNYCLFQLKKRKAKAKGLKILVCASTFMSGVNLFAVPKDITLKTVRTWKDSSECPPNGDENYQKYNVGWLMALPEHCVC